MTDDYADGGVHVLTQGAGELQGILGAAAARAQLVLLDFSASWCYPCRMMLPVLRQLAEEHRGRLVVVKVDCEQTAANQELARECGITAFPTFHLYRNQHKVGELRGADQAGLRRAITAQLALLGSLGGGASGGGGAGSGGRGPMAAALAAALARVKAGCSYGEFVAAARTLLAYVANLLDHPGDERYHRIKLSNAAFQSRLGCRAGGKECMAAIGFREMMEAGEAVLVMADVPQELPNVRQLLQQALQQAEAAAAGAAAAERRTAAPGAAPAAGTAAGSAGGGAPSATVDASALARALAAAMHTGAGPSPRGSAAAPPAAAPPAAAPGRRPPRQLAVTPRMLARALAQILRDCGIGGVPPAAAPPQQQQQQPQQQGGGAEG